jgi:P27 family predicted phage terminase small subunit
LCSVRVVARNNKGNMSRADRQKRQQEEEALKLGREKLVPPDWLSPAAAAEFVRVVDEAGKLGLWDNLDVDCVAVYATAYVGYKEATAALAREGAVIERETREGTMRVINPAFKMQVAYVKQIMTCSTKLGLCLTDRLKVAQPKKKEEKVNKFMKFFEDSY